MSIDKHFNHAYITSGLDEIPISIGDLYSDQDLGRDYHYLLDRAGLIAKDLYGQTPVLVEGGDVIQGTGLTLNIGAGTGYVSYEVTLPDDFGATVPPTTLTADIDAVKVTWPDRTALTSGSDRVTTFNINNDGSTINYVKIRYVDATLHTRVRVRKTGSYVYELTPDYEIIVDDVTPTNYDLVLMTFTSDGTVYSFILYDEIHRLKISHLNQLDYQYIGITNDYTSGAFSSGDPFITHLSGNDFAYYHATTTTMYAYRWTGSGFSILGTLGSIVSSERLSLCSFDNGTKVLLLDSITDNFLTFSWNGSVWSQLGTQNLPNNEYAVGTALNNTDVAVYRGTEGVIKTYRFDDGTNTWSQIGNQSPSFPDTSWGGITTINQNYVAAQSGNLNTLRVFRWDGTNWTVFGISAAFNPYEQVCMSMLTSNVLVTINSSGNFQFLEWDGSLWKDLGVTVASGIPSSIDNDASFCVLDNLNFIVAHRNGTTSLLVQMRHYYPLIRAIVNTNDPPFRA